MKIDLNSFYTKLFRIIGTNIILNMEIWEFVDNVFGGRRFVQGLAQSSKSYARLSLCPTLQVLGLTDIR